MASNIDSSGPNCPSVKPLLGATIKPNLVSWSLKKKFSLKLFNNDIFLGDASQLNGLFSNQCAPGNAPVAPMSKIDPGLIMLQRFKKKF